MQDNSDVASVFSGSVARSTTSERRHFTFHSRFGPVYWNDRPLTTRQRSAREGGIEVVVNGLPAYHGRQLAIDAGIVSPLRATGRPIAQRLRPGLALKRARRRKQTKAFSSRTRS